MSAPAWNPPSVSAGSWSLRLAPRTVLVVTALAALTFCAAIVAISVGEFNVPIGDVMTAVFGQSTPVAELIVNKLRAPRVVTGIAVGAAFGLSGAIFQSLTRNPLGSPDFIGFTSGAATGGIVAVIFGGTAWQIAGGSMLGCIACAVVIYVLSARGGGVQGYRLVLVGIGTSALLVAANNYLLTRANLWESASAAAWLTGSLGGRTWDHALPMLATLAVLIPVCAVLSRPMRMMELGDDSARAVGVRVEPVRGAAIAAGVLLCGAATATAGPIVFVALAAPQLARRLTGSAGVVLTASALTGALLVTLSDLAAQRLLDPVQLPVGVMTGALGGLYLLYLLRKDPR
ncbi:FecCD family ABC transporter permease [Nonomuraea sp. NPDC050663]|uniref:FecCD family ABC transporter permease n=1 Tax=Nonomuraea sp. NPDC050663 TaxID=3364370 RepID=UPI0037B4CE2C